MIPKNAIEADCLLEILEGKEPKQIPYEQVAVRQHRPIKEWKYIIAFSQHNDID
jgi:hypothetical protein